MTNLVGFALYALIIIVIIGVSLFIGFLMSKNLWVKNFVAFLMKFAEKYISIDGPTKMDFVVKVVMSLYKTVFKWLKLAIPSEEKIKNYCQNIYIQIREEVNNIKTKATAKESTANKVKQEIKEITTNKTEV